jgi:hypothetical protein
VGSGIRYLVELSEPENGWEDVQAVGRRTRAAAVELRRSGTRVRFLRSILVPEDGSLFVLVEADSAEAVGEMAARAELGVIRTAETLRTETGRA